MKASTWIKKHSTCPIETEKAIQIFNTSIVQYQLSSDSIKMNYIKQVKDNLRNAKFYAEHYVIAARAFLRYINL